MKPSSRKSATLPRMLFIARPRIAGLDRIIFTGSAKPRSLVGSKGTFQGEQRPRRSIPPSYQMGGASGRHACEGSAGAICEDLQPVRGWVLLHSWHRHLPEDGRLL